VVEELAARGVRGEGGVGEDLGERKTEDGDGLWARGLHGVFEVALVKDVALAVLDQKDDASRMAKGGFAIGVEGGSQAGSEALCAVVGGEVERRPRDWFLQERVLRLGEVSWLALEILLAGTQAGEGVHTGEARRFVPKDRQTKRQWC
jgi:hypothetical protein